MEKNESTEKLQSLYNLKIPKLPCKEEPFAVNDDLVIFVLIFFLFNEEKLDLELILAFVFLLVDFDINFFKN